MGIKIFQVDAFAARPFEGNPAAVCILTAPRQDAWMQAVAAEMNLSETAFVQPRDLGWSLRWFTPAVEVELCGHATLATAHTLWEAGYLHPEKEARFHTLSGLLTAVRRGEWIEMDFPTQPIEGVIESPQGLAEALGVTVVGAHGAKWTTLVEVASESDVRGMAPDFAAMKSGRWGSAIVTAASDSPDSSGYDFVSRFFAPAIGIDEDPVTGSAHCILGPFWAERLGKDRLLARQVSPRGGTVQVAVADERTKLSGQAVTTLKGELV